MDLNEVEIIFFDTETNGLKAENSVLSISAIKTLVNYNKKTVKILDKYERFYYPIEDYNPNAISVNKLDRENIRIKRGNRIYPKHFIDDQLSFFYFCGNIQHFVAHNIEFDRKFLKKKLPKQFCTMKSNTDIIKLPSQHKGALYKWPKLEEATQFYKISSTNDRFHDSMYDVEMTIEVFKSMLDNEKGRELIKEFLFDRDYSYKIF
ncbi:3'-5' exonuclease [Fusobacterium sp.]|uniref:3'-5' exonuclease n=1 Tax=Fusobacterium sp. TaxID=68766 RepID=UPI002628E8A8|nr:3'-5' exonuclease [Fusobacterium sp.]